MPLRDAHLHLLTHPFFDALARQAQPDRPAAETIADAARGAGFEVPDPDITKHARRWMEALDRAGVAQAVALASAPEEAEAVAEAAHLSRGRLVPFTLFNPIAPAATGVFHRAVDGLGMRGFLLFPALHDYHPSDMRCQPILDLAQERRLILIVQCGRLKIPLRDAFGLATPYHEGHANPRDMAPVAARYPGLRFIVPHFGAGFFEETIALGKRCPNVFVDTSGSNNWTQTRSPALGLAEVFRRTLDAFGPGRILFGTDSGVFPRGWRADVLAAQQEALDKAGASAAEISAVLGGNLQQLLA